ncbi:helix-turn-helix transcriptional regulator [Streptomyces sp. AM 4-1-1]|uniref:helix-turn-helix domain-containing protein n=1 Tax=Streptomyces sp. AM 4-1-1 TaxID=3028710 RepID=UPI0023B898FB|nr:helix-turn-helix transcriptional regulator [Streptomyces sp. AM 4-1-1]WEH36577.1 helix-turn-helix transcriptional regulator [Streptomyces sp. AM 4-1-1]
MSERDLVGPASDGTADTPRCTGTGRGGHRPPRETVAQRSQRPLPDARPAPQPPDALPAEIRLGLALRRLRLEEGLSLRALARRLGYSAHSAIADFEGGRRLPSEALVRSCESVFAVPPGTLLALRREALADRAGQLAGGGPVPAARPVENPATTEPTGTGSQDGPAHPEAVGHGTAGATALPSAVAELTAVLRRRTHQWWTGAAPAPVVRTDVERKGVELIRAMASSLAVVGASLLLSAMAPDAPVRDGYVRAADAPHDLEDNTPPEVGQALA